MPQEGQVKVEKAGAGAVEEPGSTSSGGGASAPFFSCTGTFVSSVLVVLVEPEKEERVEEVVPVVVPVVVPAGVLGMGIAILVEQRGQVP